MRLTRALPLLLTGLLSSSPWLASAQGRAVQFLNFEAPAHKPIAVAEVGGDSYVLVANGPDNSVEVYDTISHQFLFRVPTGQRPITIAIRPSSTPNSGRQIYVANWLGDSVTVFDLQPSAGPHKIEFVPVTTQFVGDEPVGITFLPENPFDASTQPGAPLHELVLVTFSGPAQWGSFLPGSLIPAVPQMELLHATSSTLSVGVRDPRAIAFAPPPMHDGPYKDQAWILNHRGGNDPGVYDIDLWGTDDLVSSAGSGFSTLPAHGALGTTNTQMAFAANGDLFVVGLAARNKDPALGNPNLAVGEPIHLNMVTNETGFTTSFLARYGALDTTLAVPDVLDLNNATPGAVPPTQAAVPVSNPTDLAVYTDAGGRTRVFVAGFGSDTVAMVRPGAGAVSTWQITRISVAHANKFTATNTAGVMRGPRGLALDVGATPSDRDRLYVYNRVDQTVSVLAPNATSPTVLKNFSLQNVDAEPAYVRDGRKFLASTELSAGGNVACWSCHIDGNTDFLGWNLADGGAIPAPGGPGSLIDALGPNSGFKGVMVTQPLRGLVNFEVAGPAIQDLFFSNRPYHWRGDKGFFEHFNAAFVNLMGLPNLEPNPASPAHHRGLPLGDMTAFREFTFSMHYPPNPNQPWTRKYSGTMFDPANPPTNPTEEAAQLNFIGVGAHAQLGLKAFHLQAACVGCHLLPEGSNNDLTETFANVDTSTAILNNIETAQLKGTTYKERILIRNINNQLVALPVGQPVARTHEFGLTSSGKNDQLFPNGVPSAFLADSVGAFVSGFGLSSTVADGVTKYVRELDSGTGPLVGFTATVDVPTYALNPAGFAHELNIREAQVEAANAGLAVHAWVNGALHGFWYDVTDASTPYHEVPQSGLPPLGSQSSATLLNLLGTPSAPGDFLTFHFTPLGSERRVADLSGGSAGWLAGGAPSAVSLLPARPMSANEHVPAFVGFPNDPTSFTSIVNSTVAFGNPGIKKLFTTAHYEKSLIAHAPGFGLGAERFDAPRRFRVSGTGIQDGALLVLRAPVAPGTATTPPATVPSFAGTMFWVLPLYPATDNGAPVWETAVEMEPMFLFALMNGGPFNPVVTQAFFTPYDPNLFNLASATYKADTQDIMQPNEWNWYYTQVVNQTSTGLQTSVGSWQRITID